MAGPGNALSLGELIDLELRLRADAQWPRSRVAARDAQVGRKIGADRLPAAEVYLAWLRETAEVGAAPVGARVEQALAMMSAIAGVVGALLGAAVVWGWVAAHLREPINVLHFWVTTVGVQLVLLMALLVLVLIPMPWIERVPWLGSTLMLGRGLTRLVPAGAWWLVARFFPEHRSAVERAVGEMRTLGKVYSRVRLWLAVRLTQAFAVAFNVGAVGSLVLAGYVTDPAFGWKSTRLNEDQVVAIAQDLARPWSWWKEGAPDLNQVTQTRYTNLEEQFGARKVSEEKPWGVWWPFLVASLVCYGLAPRVAVGLLAWLMLWVEMRRFPSSHAGLTALRERLVRREVSTTATDPDSSANLAIGPGGGVVTQSHLTSPAYHVLRWGGVGMGDEEVKNWLREYHRAELVSVTNVGAVDASRDAEAVRGVVEDPEHRPVLLLVGAWEPPTGDYLDFLVELRRRLGERRMVHVMLYRRGSGGWLRSAQPVEVRAWRARAATLADPWLNIEPMVEGAGA